jgi:DNA gyrase/topoisomerase IV subunit A
MHGVQGVGKRVPLDLFRTQRRGGKGLRSIKLNEGDNLSSVEVVRPSKDILCDGFYVMAAGL